MNAPVPMDRAVGAALADALAADPSLVVLAEGEHPSHAHLGALASRVEAVPVADRAVFGMAVGLAVGGRPVVVELAMASRLRALAEGLAEAAAWAASGLLARPIVVRVPWGREAGALDGPVLGLLAGIAGLRVVAASGAASAAGLLRAALAQAGPTVILEPRRVAGVRETVAAAPRALHACHADPASCAVVVLAALADGVGDARAAAASLAAEGVVAQVVDLVSAAPLDAAGLAEAVRAAGRVVIVAPADEGAWAGTVRAAVADAAFLYLEAPPASAPPEAAAIAAAARRVLTY